MNFLLQSMTTALQNFHNNINGGNIQLLSSADYHQSFNRAQPNYVNNCLNQAVTGFVNRNYSYNYVTNNYYPVASWGSCGQGSQNSYPQQNNDRFQSASRNQNSKITSNGNSYNNTYKKRNVNCGSSEKFPCNFCEVVLLSSFRRRKHENKAHKVVGCQFCSKTFRAKHDLNVHERKCSGKPKVVKSSVPPQPPQTKVSLSPSKVSSLPPPPTTASSHSSDTSAPTGLNVVVQQPEVPGDKPDEIKIKQELTKKEDSPIKENFSCAYCIKAFPSQQTLDKHIQRVHTVGTKDLNTSASPGQFQCPFCIKLFPSRRKLYFHMKAVHTAVFFCHVCPAEFNAKKELNHHVYSVHVSKEKGDFLF